MSVVTLAANSHLAIPYAPYGPVRYGTLESALTSTATRGGGFRYEVESERPTEVYLVDAQQLEAFRNGRHFIYLTRTDGMLHRSLPVFMPSYGTVYLLIVNRNLSPIAVHYQVYF